MGTRKNYLKETVLMSTHKICFICFLFLLWFNVPVNNFSVMWRRKICFRAVIREIINTPVYPSYIKVRFKGVVIIQTCYHDQYI